MTVVTSNWYLTDPVEPLAYYPLLAGFLDVQESSTAVLLADTDVYDWLANLAVIALNGIDSDGIERKIRSACKFVSATLNFDDMAIDKDVFLIDELGGMFLAHARFLIWNCCLIAKVPYAVSHD